MLSGEYKEKRKEKLESYIAKGFSEKQLTKPIEEILAFMGVIIDECKESHRTPSWRSYIKQIQRNILEASDDVAERLKLGDNYKNIRAFVNADEEKFNSLNETFRLSNIDQIPQDKKNDYLLILSAIAKDCVNLCLEDFNKEIDGQKKTGNLVNNVAEIINSMTERERLELAEKNKDLNSKKDEKKRRITWADDVVDNEGKSSKKFKEEHSSSR